MDDMFARAREALERFRATVASSDGLVEVTVGPRGELREVALDSRVLGQRDAEALARTIVLTAGEADDLAADQVSDLAKPMIPAGRDRVDVLFDPVLAELDRGTAAPPPLEDLPALRASVLLLRDLMRDAEESSSSADGLVTATVGGRGELTGLDLDAGVYRHGDSRWLSDTIVTTAHTAAESLFDRLCDELNQRPDAMP
jgi:DNA-binding protein YbaB